MEDKKNTADGRTGPPDLLHHIENNHTGIVTSTVTPALRFKMAADIISSTVRYIRDGDILQARTRSLTSVVQKLAALPQKRCYRHET